MNGWFSRAAVDRIAECALSPLPLENADGATAAPLTGREVLNRYARADSWHGLGRRRLFPDRDAAALFGAESEVAMEFYSFAGLLELAVAAGYVDLGAWEHTDRLAELVPTFLARETASDAPADVTLLEALAARLQEKRYRVAAWQRAEFNAFASLLALDRAVRNDVHARAFLERCDARQWHADLAFLVTPEQFAAVLAGELRDETPAGAIRGGLAALRAFVFLGDLLDRVGKNEALAEGFIRGVRWVQQAGNVHERIWTWAERMMEWDVSAGDERGEVNWQDVSATLGGIERRVGNIWPHPPKVMTLASEVGARIDGLIAEGRIGGAVRLARDDAERRAAWFERSLGKADAPVAAQNLLDACKRLDQLGEPLRAAVVLAPHFEQLRRHLHELHLQDGAAILARARRGETAAEPQLPHSTPPAAKSLTMSPLKLKHLSSGEP